MWSNLYNWSEHQRDKVCQWLAAGRWFSPDTLISATDNADSHDIAEILLKVALITVTISLSP